MEVRGIPRTNSSRLISWVLILVTECLLAYAVILYPSYALAFFIASLFVLSLFFYPELSYFLFLLSSMCHLFQFQVSSAHSVPPRMWRIDIVPMDIVALRALLTNILVILASLVWVFARMAKARPPYPKTALDLPAFFFFLWFVMTLFWTPDWSTGLIVLFSIMCCYLGFALSVTVIRTKKILHIAVWLLIVVGLMNAAVAAYSLHGEPVWKEFYRNENISLYFSFIHMARMRGMGFIYSPLTAYLLNVAILLALTMLLVTPSLKKRWVLALMIFFMIYGHMTTISKGGTLGLLVGLFFMVAACKPLRKHFLSAGAMIITVLILSMVLVYATWPWPEKAQLLQGRQSMAPRYLIWGAGFEEFLGTYGFGFGGGAFFPAHSIYLQILYELGIPGLMFWLWLLFKLFCSVREVLFKKGIEPYYRTMILGFSAAMISILTVSLADSYYSEETMWTLLGIGMAMINLAAKPSAEQQKVNNILLPLETGKGRESIAFLHS